MIRWLSIALLLALHTAAAGCGGGKEKPSASGRPAAEVTAADVVAAVQRFDEGDLEASIQRLDDASFADAAAVESLKPFFADPDPGKHWAGVYLATLLVDADRAGALRPLLADPDPALRIMVAVALAAHGVVESLPVLVQGLGSEAWLVYDDPPRPAADLAREALPACTGQTFATQAEWQAWWNQVGGRIRWDGKRYVVP